MPKVTVDTAGSILNQTLRSLIKIFILALVVALLGLSSIPAYAAAKKDTSVAAAAVAATAHATIAPTPTAVIYSEGSTSWSQSNSNTSSYNSSSQNSSAVTSHSSTSANSSAQNSTSFSSETSSQTSLSENSQSSITSSINSSTLSESSANSSASNLSSTVSSGSSSIFSSTSSSLNSSADSSLNSSTGSNESSATNNSSQDSSLGSSTSNAQSSLTSSAESSAGNGNSSAQSSVSASDDFRDQGCMPVDIRLDKQDLELGPEKLRDYALITLTRLARAAYAQGRAPLGKRLKSSGVRAKQKIDRQVQAAHALLDQLPNIYLVCPPGPICIAVDNSATINKYITAIRKLANAEIRTLNRASRLVYPNITTARKKTNGIGKAIKKESKGLREKAASIPATQSECHR